MYTVIGQFGKLYNSILLHHMPKFKAVFVDKKFRDQFILIFRHFYSK